MIIIYHLMKYALQIYGVFRTFEVCLPEILHYIAYDKRDIDVYVLAQKADGYSPENEEKIRKMLGQHHIAWRYIEDYPTDVLKEEDQLCNGYERCVVEAKKRFNLNLVNNHFVTRLWYRRRLNNLMRKETGIKYDWVIRTRFDIGYKMTPLCPSQLSLLETQPDPNTIYMTPDTFSCGSPEVIDVESELIRHWPYLYMEYQRTGHLFSDDPKIITNWLFMSEKNLVCYLKPQVEIKHIHSVLNIMRRRVASTSDCKPDLSHVHMVGAYYGYGVKWVDVTDKFVKILDRHEEITINNDAFGCDPCPDNSKKLLIMTLEGDDYQYSENTRYTFTYQHLVVLNLKLQEITRVTYGQGTIIADVTARFREYMTQHQGLLHVANEILCPDPCGGRTKALTLVTKEGMKYEIPEYSVLVLRGKTCV